MPSIKKQYFIMKNLLDETHRKEILQRIDSLKPEAKALWGKMNVNQGLRHMAMAFDISTGALNPTVGKIPSMPKWMLKLFLLNVKPPKEKAERRRVSGRTGSRLVGLSGHGFAARGLIIVAVSLHASRRRLRRGGGQEDLMTVFRQAAAGLAVVIGLGGPALAQSTAASAPAGQSKPTDQAQPTPQAKPPAQAPPAKPQDPTFKETVVVSASKVEQQIVDAPATMSVK